MATRYERVVLSLRDEFSTPMAKAAAATALVDRNLDRLDGTSVRVRGSVSQAAQSVNQFDKTATRSGDSVNQLTGRLRLLADTLALVGPAAVPIGAVAVPAITGLATQLGFAAAASGAAILAFQGVGDALEAMQDAALEPTAENLAEVRRQLDDLSPAAAEFTVQLHAMRDDFAELRDAAASGLFPGLTEGFADLDDVMSRLEPVLNRLGQVSGDIFADGVESLGGERWVEFFGFLEAEAQPTLTDLAATAGDFAHGLSEMWMAFQPLSADFGDWLREVADGFDSWATGLDQTEGLNEFFAYVRDTGPQVAETMGSLADALIQVVEAAAPLGGPSLAAIEAFADAVAMIADSDIGTPLLAGAAAMALLSRATQVWGAVSATSAGQFVTGQARASAGIRTLGTDLRRMRTEYGRVGAAQAVMLSGLSNTTDAARRTRASLAGVGRTAGTVGALAAVTTGLADNMGVANTASLGLLGAMVGGGAGAVAGGLIGGVMDFAAAGDRASDAMREFDSAARDSGGSITGYIDQLNEARAAAEAFATSVSAPSFLGQMGKSLTPGGFANNLDVLFGGFESSAMGKLAEQADAARVKIADLEFAGRELAFQLGIVGSRGDASFAQMDVALAAVTPAMQDLGITTEDLIQGVQDGGIVRIVESFKAWQREADSTGGRTRAVAQAVNGLGDDLISTADSATALAQALDALLSPKLDLSAATDAWTTSLRALNDDLAENSRALQGQSAAAIQNREAIRGRISDLQALLTAQANAGAGPRKLAQTLAEQRDALLDAGEAAGIARPKLAAYLREMGLTPALVRTVFEAAGIDRAEQQARNLRDGYRALPKKVRTDLEANGVPESQAAVKRLQRQYDLTPAQVRTIVALQKAAAERGIGDVQALLRVLNGATANPRVTADTGQAQSAIASVSALLASIPRSVTSRVTVIESTVNGGRSTLGGIPMATGGVLPSVAAYATGGFGDTADRHQPVIASGGPIRMWAEPETKGEAYIPLADDHRRPRAQAILEEVAGRFNGAVEWFADGGVKGPRRGRSLDDALAIAQVMREIRDLKRQLAADGKNKLGGLNRRIAHLQLQTANKELRLARRREAMEEAQKQREKARERRQELRGVRENLGGVGLSFDSIVPDNTPQTVVGQARAQIAQFRQQIEDAGGVWSKALNRWSKGLIAAASEYDDVQVALNREIAARDALAETLATQQAALDDLTRTMSAYADQVAGNFLRDPFNQSRTETVPGAPGPATAALAAAEAELAAIRSSPTGDSVASAAAASRLIASIGGLRERAEAEQEPVERTISGLAMLRETLETDINAAERMADALRILEEKGLDTAGALGGLYQQLAATGDLNTAEQMTRLNAEQVDELEKLFKTREDAAAAVGAQATQAAFGEMHAEMAALVEGYKATLEVHNTNVEALTMELDTLGGEVRAGAAAGVALLQPQIDRLSNQIQSVQQAVANSARQNAEQKKKRGNR